MPDALGPRKVLVVDDNRVSRHAVTSALGRLGIEDVRAAADGDEALAVLGEAAIDTIICDLNMPRMDGVEFLRYLAARDFRGAVVLVSGEDPRVLDAAEMLAGAHKLDVLGAVSKPIKAAVLADILRRSDGGSRRAAKPEVKRVDRHELKGGIENDELVMFYQPKVEAATQRLHGVECLVRWQRPGLGMVGPDAFVPVAEEHGLIDDLTRAVYAQAVRHGGQWHMSGLELKVAINISMENLKEIEFLEFFAGAPAAGG